MQEVRIGRAPLRLSILSVRAGDPPVWTPTRVKAQLGTAAKVFRGLPLSKVSNFAPLAMQVDVIRDFADAVEAEVERARLSPPLPTAKEIDRADQALGWLHWVATRDDRLLVWARAQDVRWRRLERRFAMTERGLRKRYQGAILVIVVRLNHGA